MFSICSDSKVRKLHCSSKYFIKVIGVNAIPHSTPSWRLVKLYGFQCTENNKAIDRTANKMYEMLDVTSVGNKQQIGNNTSHTITLHVVTRFHKQEFYSSVFSVIKTQWNSTTSR